MGYVLIPCIHRKTEKFYMILQLMLKKGVKKPQSYSWNKFSNLGIGWELDAL